MTASIKVLGTLGLVGLLSLAPLYALTRYPSLFSLRHELKLATGPIGSDGQKILAAFMRDLAEERHLIRLVPVPTETLAAGGKALTNGQVDLAG